MSAANKVLVLLIFLLISPAHSCDEFSGQTMAFTVTPGAKASWSEQAVAIKFMHIQTASGLQGSVLQSTNGTILFRTSARDNVAIYIYSVNGKRIDILQINKNSGLEYHEKLASGIYFAKFESKKNNSQTIRFLVRKR
jgi:hypothetical protein